jgi:hypothetical protein
MVRMTFKYTNMTGNLLQSSLDNFSEPPISHLYGIQDLY